MTFRSARRAAAAAAIFAFGCGQAPAPSATGGQAIINGDEEDGYPAVGALVVEIPERDPSGSFCSATLIHPQWVLTAAHCLVNTAGRVPSSVEPHEANYVSFFIGSSTDDQDAGRRVPGRRFFIHPDYAGPGGGAYDIALLELAEPVTDVAPIPIHRDSIQGLGRADVFYVGFGQSNGDGGGSGRKRSLTLNLYTVTPVVYVTSQGVGGVCFGDSGGPGLLDVNGSFEVIGVNSTVFGDPSCFEYSTQIRVDAYQTWIDAVMGASPAANCLDTPDVCQCSHACGEDGVCDNAQCGQDGCGQLLVCLRFCNTLECSIRCLLAATPETNYLYEELTDCAREFCPGGQTACIDEFCHRERTGCDEGLEAVTGPASCGELFRCSAACDPEDGECLDACWYEGTLEGQAGLRSLESCLDSRCGSEETLEGVYACGHRACRDRFLQCLPPDSCPLVGGGCEAGTACVAEPWVATYCRASEERAVAEPCDPGAVSCADGALCLDLGDGPICRQVCTVAADCTVGFAPCDAVRTDDVPFSIGVCALDCPDSDADGSCDADDCAPRNPAVFPGAVERCDAGRVDENCNGDRNEGCIVCPDGSPGPDCPEPTPAPPLPVDDGGCECVTPKGAGGFGWLLMGALFVVGRGRRWWRPERPGTLSAEAQSPGGGQRSWTPGALGSHSVQARSAFGGGQRRRNPRGIGSLLTEATLVFGVGRRQGTPGGLGSLLAEATLVLGAGWRSWTPGGFGSLLAEATLVLGAGWRSWTPRGIGSLLMGVLAGFGRRNRPWTLVLSLALASAACGDDAPADAGAADAGASQDAAVPDAAPPYDAGPLPPPTIWDIQQGAVAPGEVVTLEGVVVSSPLAPTGFFISDGTSRAFSGLWVQLAFADPEVPNVGIGDQVTITGEVAERAFGDTPPQGPTETRTELILAGSSDLAVTGQADLPVPVSVELVDLGLPEIAELYEGVVVTLDAATVTERLPAQGELLLDDIALVDDLFVQFDLAWIEPGTKFESVTGPLQFEDGRYLIEPRSPEDLPQPPPDFGECLPVAGYTVCLDRINWDAARAVCARQGGRLVILETIAENLDVATMTSTWTDRPFWVGASDRGVEGEWAWNDGAALDYDPWGPGEPNDYGAGEDCAHNNWQSTAKWNDARCASRHPFVCEFPDEGPRCARNEDCEAGDGICDDGSCAKP